MNQMIRFSPLFRTVVAAVLLAAPGTALPAAAAAAADKVRIVLVAGAVQEVDRRGHHDYLGGCLLLENLLEQTPGVEAVLVKDGWPSDARVFQGADAVVFYTDGGGKQAYLQTPERVAAIQKLADNGIGFVSIHQAVDFPPPFAKQSAEWIGAVYNQAFSGRGHWDSAHETFPEHPVTRGVVPWQIRDGWLNRFKFPGEMKGVSPLVWSSKEYQGSRDGGAADVVAWAFDRTDGGRSFSFSGLDAHSAWELEGVRKLVVNGVLWSAGAEIPEGGAPCAADKAVIDSLLTPRTAPQPKPKTSLKVGGVAPDFKIIDTTGKEIVLAELTGKGPVLVRLTCGCLGCDLELPYYQSLHEAYQEQGLISLAVFAEPDDKFAEYVKTRKLNMLYALDPDRKSWEVFATKTMPSNFLIDKGGKIVAISKGCNPDGLKAMALGSEAAALVGADEVDIAKTVTPRPGPDRETSPEK